MFFENYFNFDFNFDFDMDLLIFPDLDPFPPTTIPKKQKKRVRFNDSITEYIIPNILPHEKPQLWWSQSDLENTKRVINRQFIIFMETYNDNQLFFFRKIPTRTIVKRAFFDYICK